MWRVIASAPTGPMQMRVAVGLGFRREIEPDGERPARAVVDHDLLAELLAELRAEDARDRIGRAARRLRHDQPDRLVGKFGCRRQSRTSRQAADEGADAGA